MATIGKVLRMHLREKKSVREIVKATSLARNTVRKYQRIGKAERPTHRRPEVPTKLAPFVQAVQQALPADTRRPKQERRTARALHAQHRPVRANQRAFITWNTAASGLLSADILSINGTGVSVQFTGPKSEPLPFCCFGRCDDVIRTASLPRASA